MTRLIDADALKEATKSFTDCDGFNPVWQIIDNAPTINFSLILDNITEEDIEKFKVIWQRAHSKGLFIINEEKPTGEWYKCFDKKDYFRGYKCSKCEMLSKGLFNFCPNCGAYMWGGKNVS